MYILFRKDSKNKGFRAYANSRDKVALGRIANDPDAPKPAIRYLEKWATKDAIVIPDIQMKFYEYYIYGTYNRPIGTPNDISQTIFYCEFPFTKEGVFEAFYFSRHNYIILQLKDISDAVYYHHIHISFFIDNDKLIW